MYTQTSKVLKGTDERLQQVVGLAEQKWTPIMELLVPLEVRLQSWLDTPPPVASGAPAPPVATAATVAAREDGSYSFGDDTVLVEEAVRTARRDRSSLTPLHARAHCAVCVWQDLPPPKNPPPLTEDQVKAAISQAFTDLEEVCVAELLEELLEQAEEAVNCDDLPTHPGFEEYTEADVEPILKKLEDDNFLMYRDGTVHKI